MGDQAREPGQMPSARTALRASSIPMAKLEVMTGQSAIAKHQRHMQAPLKTIFWSTTYSFPQVQRINLHWRCLGIACINIGICRSGSTGAIGLYG